MLQIALVFQHLMCHKHCYARISNWFIEKLVGLNYPKHSHVGACLCYGLWTAFWNLIDPHLYARVGLDCNPRVKGTPGPLQWHQNQ